MFLYIFPGVSTLPLLQSLLEQRHITQAGPATDCDQQLVTLCFAHPKYKLHLGDKTKTNLSEKVNGNQVACVLTGKDPCPGCPGQS